MSNLQEIQQLRINHYLHLINDVKEEIKKLKDDGKTFYHFEKQVIYSDDDTVPVTKKQYLLYLINYMPGETAGAYGRGIIEEIDNASRNIDTKYFSMEGVLNNIKYTLQDMIEVCIEDEFKIIKKNLSYIKNMIEESQRHDNCLL